MKTGLTDRDPVPPAGVSAPPRTVEVLLMVLSAVVAVGALWRMIALDASLRFDSTTLQYLLVAAVILMLPKIKTLAYGDLKVELEQMHRVAERARKQAENAAAKATTADERAGTALDVVTGIVPGGRHGTTPPTQATIAASATTVPPTVMNDPQKGRWGGTAARGDRELRGVVKALEHAPELFRVVLEVSSTNPTHPLEGSVRFHLHDTFRPAVRDVAVAEGIARLELIAWGAFTVGAEADHGRTTLELDLSGPGVEAPPLFKSR